jgi:hypothetical protein
MTEETKPQSYDPEMESILQEMLERDEDMTARAVARVHPRVKAASSITRNPDRSALLASYQKKQEEYRDWRKRLAKRSRDSTAMDMAEKDIRIKELEQQVEILTASHVAMLRAVGELGGFAKWAQFFESYKEVRDNLAKLGAMPDAEVFQIR